MPGLTVRENLKLGLLRAPAAIKEGPAIAEIAETFPRLAERLDQVAVTLSGGEQKMLAIARAMIARPKLICSTSRRRASCPCSSRRWAGCSCPCARAA